MIQASKEIIVLADSTKLGLTGFAFVVDLRRVTCVITDSEADPGMLASLRAEGVTVQVVPAG